MPNSNIKDEKLDRLDKELSHLLNQSEPPRSPQHLDESILGYARSQAEKTRPAGSPGRTQKQYSEHAPWYRQNWIPATVTFSIAAVAVTVTLQNFGPTGFDRDVTELASQSELGFSDALSGAQPAQDDAVEVADATLEMRERSVTQPVPVNRQIQTETTQASRVAEVATTIVETDRITALAEELEDLAQQLDQLTTAPENQQDRAASADADLVISNSDNSNTISEASLALANTAPVVTTVVTTPLEARNELSDQAPAVALQQPSDSIPSRDSSSARQRNQLEEENTGATALASIDTANASAAQKPQTVGVSQQVEQIIVTGSSIRRQDSTAATAATALEASPATSASVPSTDLAALLRANPSDQVTFLVLLETVIDPQAATDSIASLSSPSRSGSSLLNLNVLSLVNADTLEDRREALINLYGNVSDPGEFLNLANQYRQLRPAFSASTPETLEAAIELLELLEQ